MRHLVDANRFKYFYLRDKARGLAVTKLGGVVDDTMPGKIPESGGATANGIVTPSEDEDRRILPFVFSNNAIDREGDRVDQAGWDLSHFIRNPVVLFAHHYDKPPVGVAQNLKIIRGQLTGEIKFADAETYAFADTVYRLYRKGFLRAVSVGFLPQDYGWSPAPERRMGVDFKRQQLLEISCVPVPANPGALVNAPSKTQRYHASLASEAVSQETRPVPTDLRASLKQKMADEIMRLTGKIDH